MPDPTAWPPRDEVIQSLIGAAGDLQDQINGLLPVVAPERRIYLTKNANDPYGGDLSNAIAAAQALTPAPSATNPVVIEILSPGTYTGNFVLTPGIFLVSLSAAPGLSMVLESSSGVTLTIPGKDSGIFGINARTLSASPTDSALEIAPGGVSQDSSFVAFANLLAPGGGTAFRAQAGVSDPTPIIFAGINGTSVNPIIDLQGGGVFAVLGVFGNDGTGTVINAAGGSFTLLENTIISNVSGGAGWLADLDGAFLLAIGDVRWFEASNLFRGQNGALVGLLDVNGFSNPSGTSLDLDATSMAFIGDFRGAPFSADPYTGWTIAVPANVIYQSNLNWQLGTSAAPDQRPVAPQPGMIFFATNRAAGTQQLIWTGSVWVDQAGTVVP